MSNLDKLKENLKSSGPIYEFKTPIVPYDVETGTPILNDYLLWCDGTKYTVTGTTNLYLLNFYNYLALNASTLATVFLLDTTEQSFVVPNLKNRVLRCVGSLIGHYNNQEDDIKSHSHTMAHNHNITSPGTTYSYKVDFGSDRSLTSGNESRTTTDASNSPNTGSIGGEETRVKAYGVFTCIDISGGAMAQLAKALEDIE